MKEYLVNEVSNRTGIMPEITEIVFDTAGEAIYDKAIEYVVPVATAAAAAVTLLTAGLVLRGILRRG
jgi:hypothetical protein